MNIKHLSILLLYFSCFTFGLYSSALAEQNRITTEPVVVAGGDPDLSHRNQFSDTGLTLKEALDLTLKYNPELAAFTEEIRARAAVALQAGLLPNPGIAVEIENFAGQDNLKSMDGAETTLAISQLIELGNKRSKRRQVAILEKELAEWDYQSKKLDVLTAAAKAFIQLLAVQEQVTLNDELVLLAKQTYDAVGERVEAGKVSPLEKIQAQVELAAARSEAKKTHRKLEAVRHKLSSFWGSERDEFNRLVGDLTVITQIPSEETIKTHLDKNPDLARWDSELEQREAVIDLARSQVMPDMTFIFGVRNFQETNSTALVAGFEIPLPLFDRNQGGISEARANLKKARLEQRSADITVRTGLSETFQRLAASYIEAVTLRDEILPAAKNAFNAVEMGYLEGKFDFIKMLDAQRTVFTVER